MRKETIGQATLYLGDCTAILPSMGRVEAVITDPPYGIAKPIYRENKARHAKGPRKDYGYDAPQWDIKPSPETFNALMEISDVQVIWGGNYFGLPGSSCWLVWDKLNGENRFADAELAWTNLPKAVRIFKHMWHGMLKDSEQNEPRVHPTQKPIAVMSWCIEQAGHPRSILDPFMGAGTTGVAALKSGASFYGIEINERYFEIACERLENAQRQERLFA